MHPDTQAPFKDNYLVDFPGLPEPHSEHKLQAATIAKLKNLMNTRHAEAVMPDLFSKLPCEQQATERLK
jgi:hypothetical protein